MFNQFNRQGHRQLSAEISEELKALAQRHGLQISVGGGQIGADELTIKVVAKTGDTAAIERRERQELGIYGRYCGLTELHYNAIITDHNGERYQLKGYSPNRPKYPIDMLNLRTGKMHKGTESYGKRFIAAYEASKPAPNAANQSSAPSPTTVHNPPPADAMAGLEALAQF